MNTVTCGIQQITNNAAIKILASSNKLLMVHKINAQNNWAMSHSHITSIKKLPLKSIVNPFLCWNAPNTNQSSSISVKCYSFITVSVSVTCSLILWQRMHTHTKGQGEWTAKQFGGRSSLSIKFSNRKHLTGNQTFYKLGSAMNILRKEWINAIRNYNLFVVFLI